MNYNWVLIFIAISLNVLAKPFPADSVGVIEKNGRQVIIYEVGAKETIYSIAKKYGIGPKSILAINPQAESGIKSGQKIFVPYATKNQPRITAQTTKPTSTDNTSDFQKEGRIYHTVEPGQTLYSISKRYGINIEDLKKWNNVQENELKFGTIIIVGLAGNSEKELTRSKSGYERIVEKGVIESFDTPEGNNFHFALHRTAPEGTIIKVAPETGQNSIFVRVIGKMPSDVSPQIILRISKIAMERLEVSSKSFKGEISYLP